MADITGMSCPIHNTAKTASSENHTLEYARWATSQAKQQPISLAQSTGQDLYNLTVSPHSRNIIVLDLQCLRGLLSTPTHSDRNSELNGLTNDGCFVLWSLGRRLNASNTTAGGVKGSTHYGSCIGRWDGVHVACMQERRPGIVAAWEVSV